MNWYKKTIKICQEEIYNPKRDGTYYYDLGHMDHANKPKKPNFLWVYYKGNIYIEEEINYEPHAEVFKDIDCDNTYSGRYESDTGELSISTPVSLVSKLRSIPSFLMDKLRRKFPDMAKVYVFR